MPRHNSNQKNKRYNEKRLKKIVNACLHTNHLIDTFDNDWGKCKRCSKWIHITDFIKNMN